MEIRRSEERGRETLSWLDSRHSFSFGSYYDPRHLGFRGLRVINEDRVHPGTGFGTHGHRDMEIISYVLAGAIEHRDSKGHHSVLRPGRVQRMSAGTGIRHSELNPSSDEPLHFLQIWIEPGERGIEPGYQEAVLDDESRRGRFELIADRSGKAALTLHSTAKLYTALVDQGEELCYALEPNRHAWLQVARGTISIGGTALRAGDGASFSPGELIELRASSDAELLLFDLD